MTTSAYTAVVSKLPPRARTLPQLFVLVNASVLIQLILCYSAFSYRVFRGKV